MSGLADKLGTLASERDLERLYIGILDAAMAATGARAGRLLRVASDDGSSIVAESGLPAVGSKIVEQDVQAGEGITLRLVLEDVDMTADTGSFLAIVVPIAELAVSAGQLSAELAGERELNRRFADAIGPLRRPTAPESTVKTVLDRARGLLGAAAAVLVAAGTESPQLAAQEGTEPLSVVELEALLPLDLRRGLERGDPWSGALPANNPLRDRGFGSAALAAVGGAASLGYLGVLFPEPCPIGARELDALNEFAFHAGAAMTSSVIDREVRQLAAVDSVTRLFNGRYFAVRLDQEAQRAVRSDTTLSLAVLTLDGLADLRAVGREVDADRLLTALAATLVPRMRASDIAARIDDDELAIILPEAVGLDAYATAERIRAAVRSDAALREFTASVGVASMPDQAEDGVELLDYARSALIWALRHGGDRAFLYHRDVAAEMLADERVELERKESLIASLSALVATLDAQQPGGRGHSERVCAISRLLATELGMGAARAEQVGVAGLLHDVGKLGLPDELLAKEQPLAPDEWTEMRRHPEIGHRMLSGESLELVRSWVLSHHERIDGGGYPAGLVGDEIPLPARIIAVANAYDAMLSERPYHPATSVEKALSELRRCSGSQFDAGVVAALEALVARNEPGIPTSVGEGG